jgi:tRNA pseudouridine55 synthase
MARRNDDGPDGLLIVDKPAGWSSHDVVARVRRLARTRRVGHAGTLDPMATGVLVLGLGRATRLLGHLALTRKEYEGTIRLGQSTVTDDAEGEPLTARSTEDVDDASIAAGVRALTGEIDQVPAAVSAIKVDGRRSYARVRGGEEVALAARPVTVYAFDVRATRRLTGTEAGESIDLDVHVECSSGTYIRALARDLGAALGVGGHLTALRRTRVGSYGIDQARPLDELERQADDGLVPELLPLAEAAAAAFPRRDVDAAQAVALAHGNFLPASRVAGERADTSADMDLPTAVFGPDGEFLALVRNSGAHAKPIAVFATP